MSREKGSARTKKLASFRRVILGSDRSSSEPCRAPRLLEHRFFYRSEADLLYVCSERASRRSATLVTGRP